MWKSALIVGVLCVAAVFSDFCKTTTGHWSSGVTDGANDFAYTGVALNDSYYCFEGCLNSAMVVQKYKVKLASDSAKMYHRRLTWEDRVQKYKNIKQRDDDPNADSCQDPVLRQDINTAISQTTNHSAKAIARSLLYTVNRPGWCINVVEMKGGLAMDSVFEDMNFCLYTAFADPEFYDIRLAAIDFSL